MCLKYFHRVLICSLISDQTILESIICSLQNAKILGTKIEDKKIIRQRGEKIEYKHRRNSLRNK